MDYKRIYDQLIEKRIIESPKGYNEEHHIIPRCIGGSDEKSNLVRLTPEEHYLAHQLLVKIHPGEERLAYAAHMMIPNRPSNKMYGWLKRRYQKAVSQQQSGISNSQYGTIWICNIESRENRKISKDSVIPEGWVRGRSKWTLLDAKKKNEEQKDLSLKIKLDQIKIEFESFLSSGKSLREYAKSLGYSHVTLFKRFKEINARYTNGKWAHC